MFQVIARFVCLTILLAVLIAAGRIVHELITKM